MNRYVIVFDETYSAEIEAENEEEAQGKFEDGDYENRTLIETSEMTLFDYRKVIDDMNRNPE